MDPWRIVKDAGGFVDEADLLDIVPRLTVAEAIASGRLIRVGRGRLALDVAKPAQLTAAQLHGTVSHLSAALAHGWPVARVPDKPWVTVDRKRKITATHRDLAHITYGQVTGAVTPPMQTVLDCARRLPFAEALAVADAALRHGLGAEQLRRAAAAQRGRGSHGYRRIAELADPRAANGIESALRAVAVSVPGLRVVPQLEIPLPGYAVHPDLVDPDLRLVVEADGWLAHGAHPDRFARDLERYTDLQIDGWLIARFGRDEILDNAFEVHRRLAALVGRARRRTLDRQP